MKKILLLLILCLNSCKYYKYDREASTIKIVSPLKSKLFIEVFDSDGYKRIDGYNSINIDIDYKSSKKLSAVFSIMLTYAELKIDLKVFSENKNLYLLGSKNLMKKGILIYDKNNNKYYTMPNNNQIWLELSKKATIITLEATPVLFITLSELPSNYTKRLVLL